MIFPLYTHVHVPAGTLSWHAVIADKLTDDGKPHIELTIPVIEEGFDGVIVRTIDDGRFWEVDLRPGGDHTKIENPKTKETFMFLDSMIKDKVTRL